MNEYEIRKLTDSIKDLEYQYVKMAEDIASLNTNMDNVSIENRSTNTAIQNLSLSFGALKEKTDSILSSVKILIDSKDGKIDSIARESNTKVSDFRSLCESKTQAVDLKMAVLKEQLSSAVETVQKLAEGNKESLDKMATGARYFVYIAGVNIVGFIGWLINAFGTAKGWW